MKKNPKRRVFFLSKIIVTCFLFAITGEKAGFIDLYAMRNQNFLSNHVKLYPLTV